MSSLLEWRPARRQDRDALKRIECTTPGRKCKHAGRWEVHHPRKYELEVQSAIRSRINPPCQLPNHCLLGWDGDELAAVAFYEELDGPAQVEVHAVAVGMPYRRKGGGWADEMLKTVLDEITLRAHEHGVDFVAVLAWIDGANRPSQDLFRRAGMRQTGVLAETTLERWSATYLVRGADLPEESGA